MLHGAGDPRDTGVDELTGLEEHMAHEMGLGDPRRCPRHPGVRTSSDDGMFDGVCGICEAEMAEEAERWEYDSENPRRQFCGGADDVLASLPRWGTVACVPSEDDLICF